MKISIIKSGEIEEYEASLNTHLNTVFGQDSTVNFNHEFVCAVLIEDDSQIVAT
ncbi:GNAT family N-acetyltransferase, partial [Vibrio cholerae]|nr:GNAT family N-acetyltransferase [Vibrio cholerae]